MSRLTSLVAAAAVATHGIASPTFEAWQAEHGVSFSSPEETAYRHGVFDATVASIESHNAAFARGDETFFMVRGLESAAWRAFSARGTPYPPLWRFHSSHALSNCPPLLLSQQAVNKFSALTHTEFKARFVGGRKPRTERKAVDMAALRAHLNLDAAPPASVDWVAKGALTAVKDRALTLAACSWLRRNPAGTLVPTPPPPPPPPPSP
jgi:hypothetical protein